MSGTSWPGQLQLPGQAAAPDGPVDLQMMYVVHHGFRRDLARLAAAVKATPVSDRATWRSLADRWQVFAEVLHKHHSGEDAGIWPWLRERAPADDVATLDAMEAEHAGIDPMLSQAAAGLARMACHPDEDTRAALAVRLVALRDSLARHLEHEETDAYALIQRLMSQEEWKALDEEYFAADLTLRYVLTVVPWAAYGLPPHVLERVFAEVGPGFRFVWLATRWSFARRERRAFAWA